MKTPEQRSSPQHRPTTGTTRFSRSAIGAGVAVLAVLVLLLKVGCDRAVVTSKPNNELPAIRMTLGERAFTLEIADTDLTRARGLMRRDSMPKDHGMIFVFDDEEELSFWMKNTRIPLDIIYLDAAGRVVSIHTMKPYDTTSVPSNGPAKYAIELNAGMAGETRLKPGQSVHIPEQAKEPAHRGD